MRKNPKKKVLVALSGGVDSAVAAALLKKQGYDVVGVFFDFGTESNVSKVKKIAKKLDIPLKIVDARKRFKKKIIDRFVSSYKKGDTPNPCASCNKEMKFDLLLYLLKKNKADYVATGHYARIAHVVKKGSRAAHFVLRGAKDKSKDQSYFLHKLTQLELSKTIFPLGKYKKIEVKRMAEKMSLPIAGKESQDVCFLPDENINDFLKKHSKPKSGNIVDEKGKIFGKHKGLQLYTIGQRKGIEIGGAGPYFVVGKNVRRNELIVSNDSKQLLRGKFGINRVNWIGKGVKLPLRAEIQIRYHSEKIPAIIKSEGEKRLTAEVKKPLRAVTPGQSAVMYKGEEVLGGGTII